MEFERGEWVAEWLVGWGSDWLGGLLREWVIEWGWELVRQCASDCVREWEIGRCLSEWMSGVCFSAACSEYTLLALCNAESVSMPWCLHEWDAIPAEHWGIAAQDFAEELSTLERPWREETMCAMLISLPVIGVRLLMMNHKWCLVVGTPKYKLYGYVSDSLIYVEMYYSTTTVTNVCSL